VCIHAYIYIYKHMCVYICTHVYTSASSYVYEYISPIRTSQYEQLICITNLTQEVWEGVHLCSLLIYARHDSCTCATWLIYVCDMTHSYVWHDSGELGGGPDVLIVDPPRKGLDVSLCVTWLTHMCDMIQESWDSWGPDVLTE